MRRNAVLALALLLTATAQGGDDAGVASSYLAATPITELPDAARTNPAAFQAAFVESLKPALGKTVGYKAALTNPRAQELFRATGPVSGVLLEKMMVTNGSTVRVDAGARLMVEADLLVRVGDVSINHAESDGELLRSIDAILPFIELPDLAIATNLVPDATTLEALNAGARFGVKGDAIPMAGVGDWMQRLAFLRVELKDQDGNVVGDGNGGALLGHPITALRWLRDDVRARGVELKPGDLLSLGSLSAPAPAQAGSCLTATYYNLSPEGAVAVKVCIAPPPGP